MQMAGKSLVSALLAGGFSQLVGELASWAGELGWLASSLAGQPSLLSQPCLPASWLGLAGLAGRRLQAHAGRLLWRGSYGEARRILSQCSWDLQNRVLY